MIFFTEFDLENHPFSPFGRICFGTLSVRIVASGKNPRYAAGKMKTRWWQLKYFVFSPRNLGKMNPF